MPIKKKKDLKYITEIYTSRNKLSPKLAEINIRAKINKIENKKKEKMNKTKICFFKR